MIDSMCVTDDNEHNAYGLGGLSCARNLGSAMHGYAIPQFETRSICLAHLDRTPRIQRHLQCSHNVFLKEGSMIWLCNVVTSGIYN